MDYTYKLLSSSDATLLKALLKVFAEAFKEPDTYQGAVPSDQYLSNLLGKEHFITLVALHGKSVVGGLTAYELKKFEQERSEIYIYDLAVTKEHRRKGIATHLIQELRRVAGKRGAYIIYVQADLEDIPAQQLYESLGIRENVFHFDISV